MTTRAQIVERVESRDTIRPFLICMQAGCVCPVCFGRRLDDAFGPMDAVVWDTDAIGDARLVV